jgi:hypothetical protein
MLARGILSIAHSVQPNSFTQISAISVPAFAYSALDFYLFCDRVLAAVSIFVGEP